MQNINRAAIAEPARPMPPLRRTRCLAWWPSPSSAFEDCVQDAPSYPAGDHG